MKLIHQAFQMYQPNVKDQVTNLVGQQRLKWQANHTYMLECSPDNNKAQ